MPELWIPYGGVETLITLQAENLGSVVAWEPEKAQPDITMVAEALKGTASVFVCDGRPPTLQTLKLVSSTLVADQSIRIFSSAPREVEGGVQELKGKINTLAPPIGGDGVLSYSEELTKPGRKVFLGTPAPDPLYGISDSLVQGCANWVSGSHAAAFKARSELEPTPFVKGPAYEKMVEVSTKIPEATYINAVPRGGSTHSILFSPAFDQLKESFNQATVSPGRAAVFGAGGKGYDDTLSGALRGVWSVIAAVRRSGALLLVAECASGLGSPALQMLASGQIEEGRKRQAYVEGIEEVFYLTKLKEEYDVILLSGLPEVYAKSALGLPTAKGSGEGIGRLLNKAGRSTRVNLVSRSPEAHVASA